MVLPTLAAVLVSATEGAQEVRQKPFFPEAGRKLQRADTAVFETHLFLRSGRPLRLFQPALRHDTSSRPFSMAPTKGIGHPCYSMCSLFAGFTLFLLARRDSTVPRAVMTASLQAANVASPRQLGAAQSERM